MKKKTFSLAALLCFILLSTPAFAVGTGGTTNKAHAASLIVPFFDVGINSAKEPLDTLLVVTSMLGKRFHLHVWDIDGNPTTLIRNVNMSLFETWSASMRDLIGSASTTTKSALTQGKYYRGFVTIDVVSESTGLDPTQSSYPFGSDNDLIGFIYYVRLLEGSSNGMDMIPLEYVGSSVDDYLKDPYQNGDGREEIDGRARQCLQNLSMGQECTTSNVDDAVVGIDSRVYLDPTLNGSSRIIVFSWIPGTIGGPSVYCATHSCPTSYAYWQMNADGPTLTSTTTLDHAVNVIDVSGKENGWVQIGNIPNRFQIFAFSFNSANPGDASMNWDAIFESYVYPY